MVFCTSRTDTPLEQFLCRLYCVTIFSSRREHCHRQNASPSGKRSKGQVYFDPAHSQGRGCRPLSVPILSGVLRRKEAGVVWAITTVLCTVCLKENDAEIRKRMAAERERRGLPPLEAPGHGHCSKALTPNARISVDGVLYCRSCWDYWRRHDKQWKPLDQLKPSRQRVSRPKDKPKATKCEHCNTAEGKIGWCGAVRRDLCSRCGSKARQGSLTFED